MTLTARISYKDTNGRDSIRNLGALQTLVIGSSMAADVQVYNEANVLGKHCQVAILNEGCFLKDLTGGRGTTQLNGAPVTDVELGERNEIEVGHNEILIEVFGIQADANSSETVESASSAVQAKPFEIPEIQLCDNGLKIFQFANSDEGNRVFADQIAERRNFFFAENQKQGGLELPDPQHDLLAELPDNIRKDHSLTLSGPTPFAELADRFKGSMENDCAILLAPRKQEINEDEFLKEIRPMVTWFLQPSSFDFHMRNGIGLLLEKAFADIAFYAYVLHSEKSWVIVTTDPEVSEFNDLMVPTQDN